MKFPKSLTQEKINHISMQAECQSLGMGQNFGSTFLHADKWPIGQRQTKSSQLWWFLPILTLRPGSQLLEHEGDHHRVSGRRQTQNSSEGGSSQHFHLFLGGFEWVPDKRIPKEPGQSQDVGNCITLRAELQLELMPIWKHRVGEIPSFPFWSSWLL